MKKLLLVSLSVAIFLGGCSANSEVKSEGAQASATKINKAANLSPSELDKLVKNTKFTSKQLRDAARELGFKCTFIKSTGSHIKKKVCNTEQQREAQKLAAKKMINDNIRSATTASLQ